MCVIIWTVMTVLWCVNDVSTTCHKCIVVVNMRHFLKFSQQTSSSSSHRLYSYGELLWLRPSQEFMFIEEAFLWDFLRLKEIFSTKNLNINIYFLLCGRITHYWCSWSFGPAMIRYVVTRISSIFSRNPESHASRISKKFSINVSSVL